MAEGKTLTPPPALYDYVLFYECASKDWNNIGQKKLVKGDGGLMNAINWNSTKKEKGVAFATPFVDYQSSNSHRTSRRISLTVGWGKMIWRASVTRS